MTYPFGAAACSLGRRAPQPLGGATSALDSVCSERTVPARWTSAQTITQARAVILDRDDNLVLGRKRNCVRAFSVA